MASTPKLMIGGKLFQIIKRSPAKSANNEEGIETKGDNTKKLINASSIIKDDATKNVEHSKKPEIKRKIIYLRKPSANLLQNQVTSDKNVNEAIIQEPITKSVPITSKKTSTASTDESETTSLENKPVSSLPCLFPVQRTTNKLIIAAPTSQKQITQSKKGITTSDKIIKKLTLVKTGERVGETKALILRKTDNETVTDATSKANQSLLAKILTPNKDTAKTTSPILSPIATTKTEQLVEVENNETPVLEKVSKNLFVDLAKNAGKNDGQQPKKVIVLNVSKTRGETSLKRPGEALESEIPIKLIFEDEDTQTTCIADTEALKPGFNPHQTIRDCMRRIAELEDSALQVEALQGEVEHLEMLNLDQFSVPSYTTYEICRICCQRCTGSNLRIFDAFGVKLNLVDKIGNYLPLVVMENDGLPQCVCRSCGALLEKFHEMFQTSKLSAALLQRMNTHKQFRHVDKPRSFKRDFAKSRQYLLKSYTSSQNNKHLSLNSQEVEIVQETPETYEDPVPLEEYQAMVQEANSAAENLEWMVQDTPPTETGPIIAEPYAAEVSLDIEGQEILQENSETVSLNPENPKVDGVSPENYLASKDSVRKFDCPLCRKHIVNSRNLAYHLKTQHASHAFVCSVCFAPHETLEGLLSHLRAQGHGTYCRKCKAIFQNYRIHVKRLHIQKRYVTNSTTCFECIEYFPRVHELRDHHLQVHQMHFCIVCAAKFGSEAELSSHRVQSRHDFFCKRCDAEQVSQRALDKHVASHRSATPLVLECRFCDMRQADLLRLARHYVDVHSMFFCDMCGLVAASHAELQTHSLATHGVRGPLGFHCEECDLFFDTQRSYSAHVLEEHGTAHKCAACGITFKTRRYLALHASSKHATPLTAALTCDLCGKKYGHKSLLQQHMDSHTTANHYACGRCSDSFKLKSALRRHERRVHTATQRYACSHCTLPLRDWVAFKAHMRRTHCTSLRFRCVACGGLFQKADLDRHEHQLFENVVNIHCDLCDVTLRSLQQFCLHISTTHNAQAPADPTSVD